MSGERPITEQGRRQVNKSGSKYIWDRRDLMTSRKSLDKSAEISCAQRRRIASYRIMLVRIFQDYTRISILAVSGSERAALIDEGESRDYLHDRYAGEETQVRISVL